MIPPILHTYSVGVAWLVGAVATYTGGILAIWWMQARRVYTWPHLWRALRGRKVSA